jgi:hypothetical protein
MIQGVGRNQLLAIHEFKNGIVAVNTFDVFYRRSIDT